MCPVCKTEPSKAKFICKDYVASNEYFAIVECENCSLQYTNPRPLEANIGRYYQSDRYISHAGSGKSEMGFTYKIYDWVRNYSIAKKLRLIKKYHQSGKLLDLGCGLGHFLNGVTQDETFKAFGADVSDEAIAYIKKQFSIDAMKESELFKFNDNEFEVITQWHVMEHVYRIDERMIALKRLLAPGGTMFIAVPISNSFDARYYRAFWDGYDVPRHLYHFTSKSFKLLMENAGFEVIRQVPMLFDAPYVSMRSEFHKKSVFAFIKGAIFGMVSTVSAWFTGNYSSILFVVKHK